MGEKELRIDNIFSNDCCDTGGPSSRLEKKPIINS